MVSLSQLNSEQKKAVKQVAGPLLILAGAGSGKTRTMCCRIAYLLAEKRIPATKILGLSFTNKAAKELCTRVIDSVGRKKSEGLLICTFHRLALTILHSCDQSKRPWSEVLGYRRNFTIFDADDQLSLLRKVSAVFKAVNEKAEEQQLISFISRFKNELLLPEAAFARYGNSGDYLARMAAEVYPRYQLHLQAQNVMDFDDLIFNAIRLLRKNPAAAKHFRNKFSYIMVDEFQDTNPAQFELLKLLLDEKENICVVGDDDQSIYSWRGADPAQILKFKTLFKKGKVIILKQNYRSVNTILQGANAVIKNNPFRQKKNLWSGLGEGEKIKAWVTIDPEREAEKIVAEIKHLRKTTGKNFTSFAILMRSSLQSRPFETFLLQERIPFTLTGGTQFFSRKEVKDFLAYLKLLVNPRDAVSLRRVINFPPRGIGPGTLIKLNSWESRTNLSFCESLNHLAEISELKDREKKSLVKFNTWLGQKRQEYQEIKKTGVTTGVLGTLAEKIKDELEFDSYCKKQANKGADKKTEFITEVIDSISWYEKRCQTEGKKTDLLEYLNFLSLDKEDESEKENQGVQLMTIHAAKGLEFDFVFITGVEEGLLPHKNSLAENNDCEERRLFYVAMTRAKKLLFLTRAAERNKYGKRVKQLPSRFLAEIPQELLQITDEAELLDPENKEHGKKVAAHFSNIFAALE